MALTGVKFDEGSGGFASNCFPVRTILRTTDDDSGAWLVAQKAEQRRRFKAVLCSKPRTFQEIRDERKKAEKEGTSIIPPAFKYDDTVEDEGKVLDGFFLMKHCCVEDPSDLCSVNISGQNLSEFKNDDFQLFDNVAYINASENLLQLEPFHAFPILRELEMPLNGLRSLKIMQDHFPHLEMLDLSFNNLCMEDVLCLGLLPSLKVLHLTGNSLRTLPADMARPQVEGHSKKSRIQRYACLEILMLDDNKLSDLTTFAALAGLRKLRHLNLSKNDIYSVPQLMLVEGRHVTQTTQTHQKSGRRSAQKSARKSARRVKSVHKPDVSVQKTDSIKVAENLKILNTPRDVEEHEKVQPSATKTEPLTDASDLNLQAKQENKITDIPEEPEPSGHEQKQNENLFEDLQMEELNLDHIEQQIQSALSVADELSGHEEPRSDPSSQRPRKKAVAGETAGARSSAEATVGVSAHVDSLTFYTSSTMEGDVPLPPPFPHLRHLNLSHNQISDEEGLLAVAEWPVLAELLIHDNPLTTETSGDPPLLARFLTDRLGIRIQRKRPSSMSKPHIEVPTKPSRKVSSFVPKVPKFNVDELIALEAPTRQPLPPSREATASPQSHPDNHPLQPDTRPLPPITPVQEDTETGTMEPEGDAFFMTQVGEQGEEVPRLPTPPQEGPRQPTPPQKARGSGKHRSRRAAPAVPEKYQGYEVLLESMEDVDISEDIPAPKDISGNIRALQYALNHPLVYRNAPSNLQQPQHPFRPWVKGKQPEGRPRKGRAEKAREALENVRNRQTVTEHPLNDVLQHKKQFQQEFTEAKELLGQVQHRYNKVRVSSMDNAKSRHAKEQNAGLDDTISDVQRKLVSISD